MRLVKPLRKPGIVTIVRKRLDQLPNPAPLFPFDGTHGTAFHDSQTGDRLDLARWLVSGENPLPPRVAVNHLWAYLFGAGIVPTMNDFGVRGDRPSHPHLLDWLAREFIDSGWDVKHMHRLIVTSASYRQSSASREQLTANDPEYQPGFEDADTSLQAAVPVYGVYDFTNRLGTMRDRFRPQVLEPMIMKAFFEKEPEKFHRASPIDRIHPDAPPFLIVHGDRDTLVPVASARVFVDALRSVSREPVLYAEVGGAQHAFELFPSLRTALTVGGVERFLTYLYARHMAGLSDERMGDAVDADAPQSGNEAA